MAAGEELEALDKARKDVELKTKTMRQKERELRAVEARVTDKLGENFERCL